MVFTRLLLTSAFALGLMAAMPVSADDDDRRDSRAEKTIPKHEQGKHKHEDGERKGGSRDDDNDDDRDNDEDDEEDDRKED